MLSQVKKTKTTTTATTILAAICLMCASNAVAFTPAEPKRMKSDFADFILNPGYGPQFTCSKDGTGKSSVLMPKTDAAEFRDFYAILGVSMADDDKKIKKEYRKLAKKFHPDINPEEGAIDMFQEINRAYEVLRDPELRKMYDWYGQHGIGTSAYSDDLTSQDAEGYEEVTYGEISSSFGDCLDPKGFQTRKERPKFQQKKRYVLYRSPHIQTAKYEKKKKAAEAAAAAAERKDKHAFGQFFDARAHYRPANAAAARP